MSTLSKSSVGTVSISLKSADLLALTSTPILPAPGTGLMYHVLGVDWAYTFGTVEYSGGSALWVGNSTTYIPTNTVWSSIETGTLLGTSSLLAVNPNASGTSICQPSGAPSLFINQPLYLGAQQPLTMGDGTLIVTVTYSVVPA